MLGRAVIIAGDRESRPVLSMRERNTGRNSVVDSHKLSAVNAWSNPELR
jgi:hypothetical protein